jgi:hypothetical protein
MLDLVIKGGKVVSLLYRIKLKISRKLNYKWYTKVQFKKIHGYKLDLKNPKTFSEKIQWMKFNGNLQACGKFVDKHEARSYVKEKVGSKYLTPQIGCFNSSEDIDFDKLPNKFVIKATHAAGWNLIVEDKTKLNIPEAKKQIDSWVNNSFYEQTGEENYKNIKGRVVIEEFIEEPSGDLMDYRFFCYNGVPRFIHLDSYADVNKRRNIYDLDWNKLDCTCGYENILKGVERPRKLNEMIEVAKKLSEGFPFVRVDLYYVENNIYFGELTFTPQNGYGKFTPTEYDYLFGEDFKLHTY